ncbi:HTTM domain-containing protein [Streptomyces sp. NPDC001922]|uniref:HTTM domain-containing protein n=1 Tax=Streptomyces sp. NPDC001922 TaxID=3364624 RepID=UPI00369B83D7
MTPISAPRRAERALARGIARVTGSALGPYQTAVIRIGFSFTWLAFLLREWPHRHELYGPDGPWNWDMARRLIDENGALTALIWSDSRLWFEAVYFFAIAAGALLLLGWRTRATSVLFMTGVLSLQNRSIFVGDGGDNVIHLMAIYLVLTRCGQVWSLDARRRARTGNGGRDRGGIVLWAVLGAVLLLATGLGRLSWGWQAVYWGLWAAQGVHGAVRRRVAGAGLPIPGGANAPGVPGQRTPADATPARTPPAPAASAGAALTQSAPTESAPAEQTAMQQAGAAGTGAGAAAERAPREVRPERPLSREAATVLEAITNLVHNGALFVIMAEVCLIYATAGWYKVQGTRWQDGTALYYPMHLNYFSPWPELSGVLAGSGVLVLLITYGTVIVQVAFPFTLFNRGVKNVLLVLMMAEHLAIAFALGLPFFSLAMIAADAVFLPTGFLRWVGGRAARLRELRPARSAGEAVRSDSRRPDRTLVG